jgi:hypothetical protein
MEILLMNKRFQTYLLAVFIIAIIPTQIFAYCNDFNPTTNTFSLKKLKVETGLFTRYFDVDFTYKGLCDDGENICLALDQESIQVSSIFEFCLGSESSQLVFDNDSQTYKITTPTLNVGTVEYYDAKFTFPVNCGDEVCLRLDELSEVPVQPPIIDLPVIDLPQVF